MNITEKLIEDVREYLSDNLDEARDYLEAMGEDWVYFYNIYDLYRDYCCNSLVELVDLFCESDVSASDYEDYYVYDGELHDACDISDDVEYTFSDDEWVEKLITCAENGDFSVSAELMKIIKSNSASWNDVKCAVQNAVEKSINLGSGSTTDVWEIIRSYREVVKLADVAEYLIKSKFCGVNEDAYAKVLEDIENDNLVGTIAVDADEYVASMHIPLTKAVEIVVKNEYMKGRWF